jgi:uncharacterized protein YqfA (UPF0365 family)
VKRLTPFSTSTPSLQGHEIASRTVDKVSESSVVLERMFVIGSLERMAGLDRDADREAGQGVQVPVVNRDQSPSVKAVRQNEIAKKRPRKGDTTPWLSPNACQLNKLEENIP